MKISVHLICPAVGQTEGILTSIVICMKRISFHDKRQVLANCAPCDEENRERNNILILAVKTRRKRNIRYGMNIRNVYISV